MRYSFFSLIAALVVFPLEAHAQSLFGDNAKAAEIRREAERYLDLNDYDRAVRGFEAAYELGRDPQDLLRAAECYQVLGESEDALNSMCQFQEQAPFSTPSEVKEELYLLEDKTGQTCNSLRGTINSGSGPFDVQDAPPSMKRYRVPAAFAMLGASYLVIDAMDARKDRGVSASQQEEATTRDVLRMSTNVAFGAAALALRRFAKEERVQPSIAVGSNGSISAGLRFNRVKRVFSASASASKEVVFFALQIAPRNNKKGIYRVMTPPVQECGLDGDSLPNANGITRFLCDREPSSYEVGGIKVAGADKSDAKITNVQAAQLSPAFLSARL